MTTTTYRMTSICRVIGLLLAAVLISLLFVVAVRADEPNPYTDYTRGVSSGVQKILVRAAELMPEEHYAFRPVDSVRTFGQIVGHVADSQYVFCSRVLGEKPPAPQAEAKTSKAELVAALKASLAYCTRAYDALTDANGKERVKFMGGDTPKLGVVVTNQVHSIEHYGNLVTYMRIQGVVPPTSDPEFMKQLMTK